jgi:hypothetical protein
LVDPAVSERSDRLLVVLPPERGGDQAPEVFFIPTQKSFKTIQWKRKGEFKCMDQMKSGDWSGLVRIGGPVESV